jgi:hypothetical protein
MNFIKWPKRPSLRPDVIAVLELRGADSLRGILASSTDGYSGTARTTSFDLGNSVKVQRAEIEEWLKWRADVEALWLRAGCVSAFAAAVLSLFALRK